MSKRIRLHFLVPPALAAALALLGCGGGLDFDDDSLPAPSIGLGVAPDTCASSGGGQVHFALQDVLVSENFPARLPGNRVQIEGSLSGVADTDQVAVVILPLDSDCPIFSTGVATVVGTEFSVLGDYGSLRAFRAVVVAHAGVAGDLTCDGTSGCLATSAGSFSAISETVEVRLTP